MALGTSLLQYLLDQEIAEWATIVSLIDHHQDLTDRTDKFKDFKHFSKVLGFIVNFSNHRKYCDLGQATCGHGFLHLLKALRPTSRVSTASGH